MPAQKKEPAKQPDQPHFENMGIVARWQPVHIGHLAVLHALCEHTNHALIGIGSSNTYDYRSPFTLEETKDMLKLALGNRQNYTLIPIPDLHDGPKWHKMVLGLFGKLDLFLTDNPYVAALMRPVYPVERPVVLVPEEERVAVSGTMVRQEIARGGDWQTLVPEEIAAYIQKNKLDQRFKQEFGLQTLALETVIHERSN